MIRMNRPMISSSPPSHRKLLPEPTSKEREENVDHPDRLYSLLAGVERFAERSGLPVIFPMHPRTRRNIAGTPLGDIEDDVHKGVQRPAVDDNADNLILGAVS